MGPLRNENFATQKGYFSYCLDQVHFLPFVLIFWTEELRYNNAGPENDNAGLRSENSGLEAIHNAGAGGKSN